MKDSSPIILCHAACTGGSLIYRLLVSAFSFIGISEVSHVFDFSPRKFMPYDPEWQFYVQNIIENDKFSNIFFDRICHCNDIASTLGKKLLIREHSHSYFFNPILNELENISWISSRYQQRYGKSLLCLLSVRDPIDSWLGLRHSFPKEKPVDFDAYCSRYLKFMDMAEKTKNIYIFKYEDMIQDVKGILSNISEKICCQLQHIDIEQNGSIASSGNSGRQGIKLVHRPRRPFTTHLVDVATNSKNYEELCARLGYVQLHKPVHLKEKAVLLKNTLINTAYYSLDTCLEKIKAEISSALIRD